MTLHQSHGYIKNAIKFYAPPEQKSGLYLLIVPDRPEKHNVYKNATIIKRRFCVKL